MSYGLRRGHCWVCGPPGHDPDAFLPWPIRFDESPADAWRSETIELALQRRTLLQNAWGWSTGVLRIDDDPR